METGTPQSGRLQKLPSSTSGSSVDTRTSAPREFPSAIQSSSASRCFPESACSAGRKARLSCGSDLGSCVARASCSLLPENDEAPRSSYSGLYCQGLEDRFAGKLVASVLLLQISKLCGGHESFVPNARVFVWAR